MNQQEEDASGLQDENDQSAETRMIPFEYHDEWHREINVETEWVQVHPGTRTIAGGYFRDCQKLQRVDIPSDAALTSIGTEAFSSCKALQSIHLPKSLRGILDKAFAASGLCSIEIPDSVERVSSEAFADCRSLTNIQFQDNTKLRLGYNLCGHCSNLVYLKLPNGLRKIPRRAFSYCVSLKSVTIPGSVIAIECFAFDNCHCLQTILFDPHGRLETIGEGAFRNCRLVKKVDLPDSIHRIEQYAFLLCRSLAVVSLPENVQCSIDETAFEACSSLFQMQRPVGVSNLHWNEMLSFVDEDDEYFCHVSLRDTDGLRCFPEQVPATLWHFMLVHWCDERSNPSFQAHLHTMKRRVTQSTKYSVLFHFLREKCELLSSFNSSGST